MFKFATRAAEYIVNQAYSFYKHAFYIDPNCEEELAIITATQYSNFPELKKLDPKQDLADLLITYMQTRDMDDAINLAEYLKESFMNAMKPEMISMMEDIRLHRSDFTEDELYQIQVAQRETEFDRATR